MKTLFIALFSILLTLNSCAQKDNVTVVSNEQGVKLKVNGKDFFINGMNWDYFPIGANFEYSLWNQSEDFIEKALESEMSLLQKMGVNTIRVYSGIPSKWITHIYKNYGIYTMLNHSFGRYGNTINNQWIPVTDYRNPETQKGLLSEVTNMAKAYKDTPGLLLFLLGNENNYGLFWAGSETEDFPDDENQKREMGEKRGRPMYKLFNEAAKLIKEIDKNHPVAVCNGDLLFADMFADECKDVDIFGTNMYRGKSFGDAFVRVKKEINKPILFTEFGADAFNAKTNAEDQKMQAYFMIENWKEIYLNAANLGNANNSIGGFTFQFSDGWWKYGQTKNLEIHDNNASWSSAGYHFDFTEGSQNMNEEWFGICAKETPDQEGFYVLKPRVAYYAIQEIHQLNPYKKGLTKEFISNYFKNIQAKHTGLIKE
ncbi:glycoside hydrolase family 2 TIM barrel-domain containing protein [Polaribacter sp. Asnod6-C07]|uniref:glycoside hydrolase family 2 TIM barrel-domain containing protein n=1 Tax=Polaribacter sp. Asnod6-C07 TaxID=3160582 RepID=UPI00386C6F97